MKSIIKAFGLLTAIATVSGAFAATSRASLTGKPASRLPSIAGHIVAGTTTVTTTSSATASYLDNTECIDKYTDCVKADDVCGSDFEECTTKVLFHGQMAKCLSVLYQCSSSGVNALFGTSAINALGSGETRTNGDITDYTYPLPGSVLGQLITGASISNRLSTEQCVKNYTRCLKRDEVCGGDFELCTDNKAFKKQAVLCDSTLQRCQSEGKKQLFGNETNANAILIDDKTVINIGGRIEQMIKDGASLAAMNAVNTCKKVTDNCLISACTKNPLRCVEGISLETINQVDIIASGDTETRQNNIVNTDPNNLDWSRELTTSTTIQKWLKSQCLETIGGNQYCHITYREKTPSKKDLVDIDLQEDVFALAYDARKNPVNIEIQKMVTKFDTKAKDACYDTIKSCAMRSCGGGLGSVCYKQARTATQSTGNSAITGLLPRNTYGEVHVNNKPYNDIKSGCSAIVNADANCIYAATASSDVGYSYTYYDDNDTNSAFNRLFQQYTGSESDPIGAVGKLNALLATSYNDAAIENMKKQCQTVALSCVKSMCGKDYVNCYRNRTDIVSGTYDTGNGKLDRSMNKMGGILDYNIVIGLCMNNVKTSAVCEEHLKVATATWRDSRDADSWKGANSVRESWLGANTTTIDTNAASNNVIIGCMSSNCNDGSTREPVNSACPGEVDEDGCIYDTPVTQSQSEYALTNGATTLFQTLLVDIEKEAQAKYNAKLTNEQNVCLSNNNGGIMGSTENGSTFMWVKLKGNKVPKNYAQKGLQTKDFTASNDLYGSFCRVKVTVMSDDKAIQDNLGADATAYFAVGDSFTCGSWISQKTLEKISEKVGEQARKEAGEGSSKSKWTTTLATVLPAVAGAVGGYALTDAVQKNNGSLGGLLSGQSRKTTEKHNKAAESCLKEIDSARTEYYKIANERDNANAAALFQSALNHATKARTYARSAGADISKTNLEMGDYEDAINDLVTVKGREAVTKTVWKAEGITAVDAAITALEGNVCCGIECQQTIGVIRGLKGGDASAEKETQIIAEFARAKQGCRTASQRTQSGQCDKTQYDACVAVVTPTSIGTETKEISAAVDDVTYGTKTGGKAFKDSDAYGTFLTDMNKLESACQNAQDEAGHSKRGANIVGAAAGAVALGGTGFFIAKAAQGIKYANAENEAIKEWMENIGDHIQCYVGTEEVGTYGDVIGIEIN